jgi:hypothetical protein
MFTVGALAEYNCELESIRLGPQARKNEVKEDFINNHTGNRQ